MKINELPTPCYVIDEKKLRKNLEILKKVKDDTGCKILLAQKAFSNFFEYPLIGQYLDGTTASGLFEASLDMKNGKRKSRIRSGLQGIGDRGTHRYLRTSGIQFPFPSLKNTRTSVRKKASASASA